MTPIRKGALTVGHGHMARLPGQGVRSGRVPKRFFDRRVTTPVRRLLDDWLPPVVREWRPLNSLLARVVHGKNFDLDFKERAFRMSDREIAEAYGELAQGGARFRDTDTTPSQIE